MPVPINGTNLALRTDHTSLVRTTAPCFQRAARGIARGSATCEKSPPLALADARCFGRKAERDRVSEV